MMSSTKSFVIAFVSLSQHVFQSHAIAAERRSKGKRSRSGARSLLRKAVASSKADSLATIVDETQEAHHGVSPNGWLWDGDLASRPTGSLYDKGDCGYAWLTRHAGIKPCVLSWPSPVSNGSFTVIGSSLMLKVENCADSKMSKRVCKPDSVEIWVGAHGPESLAKMADPAQDGTCSWNVSFEFTQNGKYALEMKLLSWQADEEFDYSLCHKEAGKIWEGGQLVTQVDANDRLYVPQDNCCELCTRDPRCTHYSVVSKDENPFEYNGKLVKCILLNGATHTKENNLTSSGVSREQSTTHYLGFWPNAWDRDAKIDASCDTEQREAQQYLPGTRLSFQVNGATTNPSRSVDAIAVTGKGESPYKCAMVGVKSIPPDGRWLRVDGVGEGGNSSHLASFLNKDVIVPTLTSEMCGLDKPFSDESPFDFVGSVKGPVPDAAYNAAGDRPRYYWQPYRCDLHHFKRREIRQCLLEKNITKIVFQGDSVVTSWGTGFYVQFYELLVGCNHTKERSPYHNLFEHQFNVSCNLQEFFKDGLPYFDVLIHNFMMPNAMWHDNLTQIQRAVQQEVASFEMKFAAARTKPRLYYLTPSSLMVEREAHVTHTRGVKIAQWLRQELLPRGWIELDFMSLSMARGFDSTCVQDGMHPSTNVRAMMAQVLANHLCYS